MPEPTPQPSSAGADGADGRAWVPDPAINAVSFGFAALIGVVFGDVPAQRAARLDPIEALRHD